MAAVPELFRLLRVEEIRHGRLPLYTPAGYPWTRPPAPIPARPLLTQRISGDTGPTSR